MKVKASLINMTRSIMRKVRSKIKNRIRLTTTIIMIIKKARKRPNIQTVSTLQ
jgi:hypothetical protein